MASSSSYSDLEKCSLNSLNKKRQVMVVCGKQTPQHRQQNNKSYK